MKSRQSGSQTQGELTFWAIAPSYPRASREPSCWSRHASSISPVRPSRTTSATPVPSGSAKTTCQRSPRIRASGCAPGVSASSARTTSLAPASSIARAAGIAKPGGGSASDSGSTAGGGCSPPNGGWAAGSSAAAAAGRAATASSASAATSSKRDRRVISGRG